MRNGQSLLAALWVSTVFWPLSHWARIAHPLILVCYPLSLGLSVLWRQTTLKVFHGVVVTQLTLAITWHSWATWEWLGQVAVALGRKLTLLPIRHPLVFQHHWAAPALMVGMALAWWAMSCAKRAIEVLIAMVFGTSVDVLAHVIANIPIAAVLALSWTIILGIAADQHQRHLTAETFRGPRTLGHHLAVATAVLLPGMTGLILAHYHPIPRVHLPEAYVAPFFSRLMRPTTGYGSGITQINHSLVTSAAPVFLVRTESPSYWTAATYNTFTGLRWSNRGPSPAYVATPMDRGIPLIASYAAPTVSVQVVRATFTDLAPSDFSTAFYTGIPTHLSVSATVNTRANQFLVNDVRQYQLTAVVPEYSEESLQHARWQTPPSALDVDLTIPGNLSPRVSRLAHRIAGHLRYPWQAAIAVKQYLDTHYRYSYVATPARTNVVNHFLFDDREGYCDQFSTAFIIMMRTLHIPARWVVGYAVGTWTPQDHGYLVRADDAHAWAEIWIASVGWVPIDPTPGFHLPLAHLEQHHPSHAANDQEPVAKPPLKTIHLGTTPNAQGRHPSTPHATPPAAAMVPSTLAITVGGALVLGTLVVAVTRSWRRHPRSLAERLFHHLVRQSGYSELTPRQWGSWWLQKAPEDADWIWPLVRLLEHAFYRKEGLRDEELHELLELAHRARRRVRRLA